MTSNLSPVPLHTGDPTQVHTTSRPPAHECWFWAGRIFERNPFPTYTPSFRERTKRKRINRSGFALPVLWSRVIKMRVSPRIYLWCEAHGPLAPDPERPGKWIMPKLFNERATCPHVHLINNDPKYPLRCINPYHLKELKQQATTTSVIDTGPTFEEIRKGILDFTCDAKNNTPNIDALFAELRDWYGLSPDKVAPVMDQITDDGDPPPQWRKAWKLHRYQQKAL